jgi:hypothetical protein
LWFNTKFREVLPQRLQYGFDKYGFTVKHIHLWRGDFAMNQQGHVDALHGLEHIFDQCNGCDAMIGICRGMRRIKLTSRKHALSMPRCDLCR